jgi:hypothetical protein
MSHWADKVVDLLTASTRDLRELAEMAGGDPRTFYRGINLEDLELTHSDDIGGMQFGEITESDLAHAATLSALAKRRVFIKTHTLSMRGNTSEIDFSYNIDYPSFSGAADFSDVNTRFAEEAADAARSATPPDNVNFRASPWFYQRRFTVHAPSLNAVAVEIDFDGYSGGAHGYSARTCTLVDVHRGKFLNAQDVFTKNWTLRLLDIVIPNLEQQFIERPGYSDALEPNSIRDLLLKSARYSWQAERLVLVFNAYEIGPYAAGPYSVEVPYHELEGFLPQGWGTTGPLMQIGDAVRFKSTHEQVAARCTPPIPPGAIGTIVRIDNVVGPGPWIAVDFEGHEYPAMPSGYFEK